ncbi:HsdM family class I SAM-dependent methyltransferase [Chitinophaga flava]|uniref:site-specific DNA-methyltransferase (adenine-specific) n=1 Tax=Chitinophaga flava TaxID=2259036 RepID=A0A365XZ82_9BACT|nr:class I SAM-dependent DNA methyltransferase [Chitinophaga flava]RBL91378.1 SAM-dependent methyltransferase [Chitinophaga flava]
MIAHDFAPKAILLIDELKSLCAQHGLGNDGNEFKIISQLFLYKFINDKFLSEARKVLPAISRETSCEQALGALSETGYASLLSQTGKHTAILYPHHFIATLHERQQESGFAQLLDDTLQDINHLNSQTFTVKTFTGSRIPLFDALSLYITDSALRDQFCKAAINKIAPYQFGDFFSQPFDFFATIFEYLIKDYNIDSGGKYAEYYTPAAVAKVIAAILVPEPVSHVSCYDPAAGSGSLLLSLSHTIGADHCTLYSQDISQKSSNLLRLNLILNNLTPFIHHIIQGNTITQPYHREKKFDFIVSNPPFKLDFSDYRQELDTSENKERFFAGIPKIPGKSKDKMAIYLLFIQHVLHSLAPQGKAAIVVPTGFTSSQSGLEKKIREQLIKEKLLRGVLSMPGNLFATTGTHVSVLFLEKNHHRKDVILMDASKSGTTIREGKSLRTILSTEEETQIISAFNQQLPVEGLSVVVSYDDIETGNYSLNPGQYFEMKADQQKMTPELFHITLQQHTQTLKELFAAASHLEKQIHQQLEALKHE